MKYYGTWQEALVDYIEHLGHNFKDAFSLLSDFEVMLMRNAKGTYFIYYGEQK